MVATKSQEAGKAVGGNFYAEGVYCHTDVKRGVTKTRTGTRLCCLTTDFLVGFRRAIIDECGPAADTVFKSCGKKWGGFIAKRFSEDMASYFGKPISEFTLAKFQACLGDYFSHHGWGVIKFDLSKHDQGLITITSHDPVYAAIVGKNDKPSESMMAGVFAGMCSDIFGEDLDCVQTKCKTQGHDASVFLVALTSRLAGVPAWMEAGKNHDQILRELSNLRI